VLLRHPFGGGDGPADEQRRHRHSEQRLGEREDREVRSGRADDRGDRQAGRAAHEDAPQRRAAADRSKENCRQARGQPRHRPQLARRGGGDVQVVRNLREHGCEHDQARLGREQAQEQRDRDGHLDPSPRGQCFGSFHGRNRALAYPAAEWCQPASLQGG
jgi:hypothetical protein